MEKINIGIIGLGPRAEGLFAELRNIAATEPVEVSAICDLRPERIQKFLDLARKYQLPSPETFTNYHELISSEQVDAVLAPTSWNSHLKIARDVMGAGKYVGIEVGGASSINELWQLVQTAETAGGDCMLLENCCYGRNELLALNLARKGLFGELIYCECGYEHDLSHYANTLADGHERAFHNLRRCGDLYPTHGLGPIAKILRINRGNRFVSLRSTATKARGFAAAAERDGFKGALGNRVFNEGDVVTTDITCANGEVIHITHSVSLPRPYSRDCRVQGTRGLWLENADGIYIEGRSRTKVNHDVAGNPYTSHYWDRVADYYEEFDHPLWKKFPPDANGGHGGLDHLTLRAFCDTVRRGVRPPIDVYDCAAWMCITCLSEDSIAMGGAPVAVPDFTNGAWINRPPEPPSIWQLDEIFDGE